jgi:predicted Fe-S protein YdhL (DUF1289 family)
MRKREERFTWMDMTIAQQKKVIQLCKQRYKRKMAKQKEKVQDVEPQSRQVDLF